MTGRQIGFFKNLIIRIRIWNNRRRSFITFRWEKNLPRLVIHEKYESYVRWTLRALTLAGIIASIFSFPLWYFNFTFALLLVGIEQFLERSVFRYTSIFVQPFPDFTYDPDQWLAMVFSFPEHPSPDLLNIVGCGFASRDYAKNFFSLLRAWNYGGRVDKEGNICLSFIIENDKEYSVYIYPNPEREIVKRFFTEMEEKQKDLKHNKEQQKLVTQIIFCKLFPYGPNSMLNLFLSLQPKDQPVLLAPFIKNNRGQFERLQDEEPLLVYKFKTKARSELSRFEVEYQHGKDVMGK